MNRRKKKIDPETRAKLHEQYITIAGLLIKIIGESTSSKILRAILIGAVAAASQMFTDSPNLPEGALPDRVQVNPATPSTTVRPTP